MPPVVKKAPAKSVKAQVAAVKKAKKAVVKKAIKKPIKKTAPKKGKKLIKKLVKKLVKKPKVKAAEVVPENHKYARLDTKKPVAKWHFAEYILNAVASTATADKKWVTLSAIVAYVKSHYPLGTRKVVAANVAKALNNLVLSKYLLKKKKSARFSLKKKGLKAAPSVVSVPKYVKPVSTSKPRSSKPRAAKPKVASAKPKVAAKPVPKAAPKTPVKVAPKTPKK
jgi:hypothetical protein